MKNTYNLHDFILKTGDEVKTNARVRYLPDKDGVYQPYELLCFPSSTFIKPGWESSDKGKISKKLDSLADKVEESSPNDKENKRKSYQRARNNLFNLLLCTMEFDCFLTLTLDKEKIDRYDYNVIIKKLSQWLDNRVRRNGLVYAIVPEYHKDKAIHFHGLCNFSALKTERSKNAHNGKEMFDNEGRPIYNISDFPFGFNTVIPLSGDNAREATAKYCYKYITKSDGEKVGGRYYLSGGKLGRPKYKYIEVVYEDIDAPEIKVGDIIRCKKVRLSNDTKKKLTEQRELSDDAFKALLSKARANASGAHRMPQKERFSSYVPD